MMKKYLLVLFFFTSIFSLFAQSDYFNRRFQFDENFHISDISSVVATDSAYYATIVAIDTSLLLNNIGSVFVKFDMQGDVEKLTYHIDSLSALQTWFPTLNIDDEGNFVTCGKYLVYDENLINRAILIRMNEVGEYIQTKEYYSPYVETEDFIAPISMSLCSDGGYIVLNNIANTQEELWGVWVTKFDADFNLIWDKKMMYEQYSLGRTIAQDFDGNFLIGMYTTDYNYQHRFNLTSQNRIYKLNTNGELLWIYETPEDEIFGDNFSFVPTSDGGVIVAGLEGEELTYPIGAEGDSIGYLVFEHTIFKLDEARNVEWKTRFSVGGKYTGDETKYVKIVKASDNTGYVAGGVAFFRKSNEEDSHERAGWLTKVSPAGDSLWARHLYYLDTVHFANRVLDLDNAPDGGYIIGGVSFKYAEDDSPQQQGWLLKVDEYGCLVPGCQGDFVDVTDEKSSDPLLFRILLYPNPVQGELYVHFVTKEFYADNRFRITSIEGKVMREFSSIGEEGTFIIPVRDYPSGMYVLEYYEEGHLMQTQQFVKE